MKNKLKEYAPYIGILSFFAFGYGYFGYGLMHMPPSYDVTNSAPADQDVTFDDYGARPECRMVKGVLACMPIAVKECIVATGECHTVQHPIDHPLEVTTCWDPVAHHKIFYTAASKFCLGQRV